jgi:hypothetical protein
MVDSVLQASQKNLAAFKISPPQTTKTVPQIAVQICLRWHGGTYIRPIQ